MFTLRQIRGADDNGPSVYECETCPAFTRAIRGCHKWPPPEVERLMELAPEILPANTRREDMLAILEAAKWPDRHQLNLSAAIRSALQFTRNNPTPPESCPVNDISEQSHRWVRHFNRCQSFGSGMGGLVPPCADVNKSDVRTVQAFQIIYNESERLRQLDRKSKEG